MIIQTLRKESKGSSAGVERLIDNKRHSVVPATTIYLVYPTTDELFVYGVTVSHKVVMVVAVSRDCTKQFRDK